MKVGKNIFWGLFFIVAAVFVIVGNMGYFGEIGFWTLLFSFFLVAWFLDSVVKVEFGGMLFSLAFAAILYDEVLGIEQLTPWPVLMAALFGTIGLNMIFKDKKKSQNVKTQVIWDEKNVTWNNEKKQWETVDKDGNVEIHQVGEDFNSDDETFRCEVAFGSAVKYISSRNLRTVDLDNAFGSLVVYFDNAALCEGKAVVELDNSFGKTTLYIPKEWDVKLNMTKAFGNASEVGHSVGGSGNTLYIKGETSFGAVEIVYI